MPSAGLAAGEFPVYKKSSSTLLSLDPAKNLILPSHLASCGGQMNLPPTTALLCSQGFVPGRATGTGSKTIGAIVPARRSRNEKRALTISLVREINAL